jgi:hypothetical protein
MLGEILAKTVPKNCRGGFTNQFSHPQITLINPPPPHRSLEAGFYHWLVIVKDIGERAPTFFSFLCVLIGLCGYNNWENSINYDETEVF